MRVAKDGVVRREEFLDVSLRLLNEKGYDETTVNDIIEAIGVSKGAFYYYFSSKEDVIKAIAAQQAQPMIDIARQAADDPTLNGLEKLNKLIDGIYEYRAARTRRGEGPHRVSRHAGNARLRYTIEETVMEMARPAICSIIEQGVAEGLFDTGFPEEAAEMYIRLASILRDTINLLIVAADGKSIDADLVKRKTLFFEDALERILGAKKGSIKLVDAVMRFVSGVTPAP
ncbi:MAG: TetR/AcrR family transcriptional regulator [Bacillota bacterium]